MILVRYLFQAVHLNLMIVLAVLLLFLYEWRLNMEKDDRIRVLMT